MTVGTPAAADVSASPVVHEPANLDERWAAWRAKSAAHDRAVRRKMAIAAPIVIAVGAVVAYLLLA
jgi:hypothetical protein